jgi:ubiquinone/menaquinone biosynthesis C-methylase UbiE
MLRKMTKDVGRFAAGDVHDFPKGTWMQIAHDYWKGRIKIKPQLNKATMKRDAEWAKAEAILDKFSKPLTMDQDKANRYMEAIRSERLENIRAQRSAATA